MKIFAYLIIALLFMNASCKSKQKTTEKDQIITIESPEKAENTPFKMLLEGSHSNIQKREYTIIKNSLELGRIFGTINSTRRPGFPIPEIDFSKNVVVGLFMGSKGSGGHSIAIDHVDYNEAETVVYYIEKHPSGMATSVMTQPFYLAKISKTANPIRFEIVKK